MRPIFISGIGTEIGKTIVSAVLVEKLEADYWKPIQSGELNNSDSMLIERLISNKNTFIHPEAYRLTQPFSPHKSAALDGIHIDIEKITLPKTKNKLVIEGAGGLMVPINHKDLIIDLIKKFDAEVVLVSKNYLGSINHTLLSVEALKSRNIPIRKLIFSGETNSSSEDVIESLTGLEVLRVPFFKELNKGSILDFCEKLIF